MWERPNFSHMSYINRTASDRKLVMIREHGHMWIIMCGIFLGWFDIDSDHNHNVYVSGLPLDITVEEFVELMGKCGIIMEDEKGRYGCVTMG